MVKGHTLHDGAAEKLTRALRRRARPRDLASDGVHQPDAWHGREARACHNGNAPKARPGAYESTNAAVRGRQ